MKNALLDFIAGINANATSTYSGASAERKQVENLLIDLLEIALPAVYRVAATGNVTAIEAVRELEKRIKRK